MTERTQTYQCQRCGTAVIRRLARGQRPKWCPDCRKARPHDREATKACRQCGTSGVRKDADYCSKTCAGLARQKPKPFPRPKRWPRAPRSRIFITPCCVCTHLFTSRYTVTTCSPVCAEAKRLDMKRAAKHRRRALKRQAFVANVSPRAIYDRDGWCCQLCGKPIKRNAVAPHPLAPTIDHVVPLAVGGSHEPANVQAAHFLCNARKGDRGSGQLRLIG